jgi:hypothetical protein
MKTSSAYNVVLASRLSGTVAAAMRIHCLVVVSFLYGCGSSGTGTSNTKAELAKAEDLEKSLSSDYLFVGEPKGEVGFPVLKSEVTCGDDVVKASYDPYRDVVSVAFVKPGVLATEARTLMMDGKRVWSAKRPFKGSEFLVSTSDSKGDDTDWSWVEDASTKHKKLFPVGADVTIGVGGTTMVARERSGGTFSWGPAKFAGVDLKLHVFSRAQVAEMVKHRTAAKRARLEVEKLNEYDFQVHTLRKSKEPKAIAVVKRYDELMAAAKQKQEATKTMPFFELSDSIAVECATRAPTAARKKSRRTRR